MARFIHTHMQNKSGLHSEDRIVRQLYDFNNVIYV